MLESNDVEAKNEISQCKSVDSCKLTLDLLVTCQGTRWSCHCWWDGSPRKWKGCFQGNIEEIIRDLYCLFSTGKSAMRIGQPNRNFWIHFSESTQKLSKCPLKKLSEPLMNIMTLMKVGWICCSRNKAGIKKNFVLHKMIGIIQNTHLRGYLVIQFKCTLKSFTKYRAVIYNWLISMIMAVFIKCGLGK